VFSTTSYRFRFSRINSFGKAVTKIVWSCNETIREYTWSNADQSE